MTTRHLLFEAGGLSLAAPADLVKAIHEKLTIQVVDGTHDWFRGLAVTHGKLLPVTDVGAFCGRRSSTGHTLELSGVAGLSGLQVDFVHGLSDTPVTDIPLESHDSRRPGDDKLALTSRAIAEGGRIHRLLDVTALVQSPAFLNIAETSH